MCDGAAIAEGAHGSAQGLLTVAGQGRDTRGKVHVCVLYGGGHLVVEGVQLRVGGRGGVLQGEHLYFQSPRCDTCARSALHWPHLPCEKILLGPDIFPFHARRNCREFLARLGSTFHIRFPFCLNAAGSHYTSSWRRLL